MQQSEIQFHFKKEYEKNILSAHLKKPTKKKRKKSEVWSPHLTKEENSRGVNKKA
ncbi:MAG: hypothetical protein U9N18_02765 [Campylobacterota bacterium]|nr:hypothetical protein [Campylobacterota bacterium]